MTNWEVGSIARVKRPNYAKAYGKAMIATLQKDDDDSSTSGKASLLWEPVAPQPLANFSPFNKKNSNNFLVTPRISEQEIIKGNNSTNDSCEKETIGPLQELSPLMEFETSSTAENDIGVIKERGDALLKAGDASAAVPYYEAALLLSGRSVMESPSVGSSIILKTKDGYLKVAEIDCVDKDEDSFLLDVTFVETGKEMEISNSAALLGILERDGDERLQERILLNLSRCLHQLADVDESKHRPKYLKSVVMSCSLAIVLAEFYGNAEYANDDAQLKSKRTLQSALHLRAKAYTFLFKWPHAKQDAKRLIKEGKEEQGKSLLANIDKRKEVQIRKDKKLAKAVTKFVKNAMSDVDSAPTNNKGDGSGSAVSQKRDEREDKGTTFSQSQTKVASSNPRSLTFFFAIAVVIVVVAVLVQKIIAS